MTTTLERFVHDELETSSAVRIDVAPSAINVFFYIEDDALFPHGQGRVCLGAMIDATTGKRIGAADVVLVNWDKVIDTLKAEADSDTTEIADRVVDGYIERHGIRA